jgi:glycosyltransferase involved in cell wall biosynthesis
VSKNNVTAPVSVVISSFEEGEQIAETIKSLLAGSYIPIEIIIVDDGSTDGSCARDWPPTVRVLRQQHSGIARARNVGADHASQPFLVFLDAHCMVASNWLEPLLHVLERVPEAMLGPAVRDERQPLYVGCGAEIVDSVFTYRWCPVNGYGIREVGVVPGGCLAVLRERFISDGGFGPFHAFGLEDVDLALRWWRAGRPILGVAQSQITHRFRTKAPYKIESQAWVENVLRTALRNLAGGELQTCVLSCSQFSSFNAAIAAVLAESWIDAREKIKSNERRTIDSYIERWAPRAWKRQAN